MRPTAVPPSQLHSVVLLYLSVFDPEAWRSVPCERHLTIQLARRRVPASTLSDVEAVVDTALLAIRSGVRPSATELAGDLCETLSVPARQELLGDLGLLARAGGRLTRREAEAIALLRCLLMSYGGSVVH